jgi:type IV pilus assembly protein PilW
MKRRPHFPIGRRHAQRGFTIIELMVALVIGLSTIGAMYSAYFTITTTTKTGRAITQVTEDASVALNILRSHISHTGYSRPVSVAANKFNRAATSVSGWLKGCDANFADLTQQMATLACSNPLAGQSDPTGAHFADTVAAVYEATVENSVTSGGQPVDCLGNAFRNGAYTGASPWAGDLRPGTGAFKYYQSYSRFYLLNGSLYCRGSATNATSGENAGQPLVDNIADMQITYGIAESPTMTRVISYKTASQVTAATAWDQVLSVRVCLLVRSVDQVMDRSVTNTYQGCDPFADPSSPADTSDFRMYRPFTSTIFLNERLIP